MWREEVTKTSHVFLQTLPLITSLLLVFDFNLMNNNLARALKRILTDKEDEMVTPWR